MALNDLVFTYEQNVVFSLRSRITFTPHLETNYTFKQNNYKYNCIILNIFNIFYRSYVN